MTDPNIPPKEPQDLFPYSYWFSFLVEVIDDAGQKEICMVTGCRVTETTFGNR